MNAAYKRALVIGGIGLFINLIASVISGCCGPVTTLIAGAIAGWQATRVIQHPTQNESARSGAVSGAITGGLMLIGQTIGALISVFIIQASGMQPIVGRLPENSTEQVIYLVSGAGAGICFGVVGILLAAGAGALAAYLTWKAPVVVETATPPNPSF